MSVQRGHHFRAEEKYARLTLHYGTFILNLTRGELNEGRAFHFLSYEFYLFFSLFI